MAEEKSNYSKIVIGVAVVSISLILVLKERETEHWERSNTTLEENASALEGVTRYRNILTE